MFLDEALDLATKKYESLFVQKTDLDIPGYHYVEGVVYSPLEIDTDGETMTAYDVMSAAYGFLSSGKVDQLDIMHNQKPCGATVVTNYLAKKNDPDGYPEGSWILGALIPEGEVWDAVKDGKLNGWSLQASVKKFTRKVTIDIIKIASGEVEPNVDTDILPRHTHQYYAEFNGEGRVSMGATDTVLEHNHQIKGTIVTEQAMGHNHRFDVSTPINNQVSKYNPNHDSKGRFAAHGGGFVTKGSDGMWVDSSGKILSAGDQKRLAKVPPAWQRVELNSNVTASLQVRGVDSKGRTQYLYSTKHSEEAAAAKFKRLQSFNKDLPTITKAIRSDLAKGSDTAAVLFLIHKTGFRVGSTVDTKAAKKAYGASTLESQHIQVQGNKISFDFVGKKGVRITKTIDDPDLAAFLKPRLAKNGAIFNTTDTQARSYLKTVSNRDYKVKDFRTWHGTNKALETVQNMPKPTTKKERIKAINTVGKVVAEHLGNTPTVALKSYIAPEVFAKWEDFND